MMVNRKFGKLFVIVLMLSAVSAFAEDGYRLWMRYEPIQDTELANSYKQCVKQVVLPKSLEKYDVIKEELQTGLGGLLGIEVSFVDSVSTDGALVISNSSSSQLRYIGIKADDKEAYAIKTTTMSGKSVTAIMANGEMGLLYGVFHFLRLIQTQESLDNLSIVESPQMENRLLDHWDNLDGSIERGYAGRSIWQWNRLPDNIDPRIKDYARANASIGINGTVLNNVNTQAEILRSDYLEKAAAIADVLRPYGVHVYFSIKFTSPRDIGGLPTADPLDPAVIKWWKDKADEIYKLIPDFGGFLVKAYSEGQPGPQQYGRSHAEGANVLAKALAPHGGIVMWRAFVYDLTIDSDRTKCAYLEFVPLDGKFDDNVFVQSKNGPVDFQPREPFSAIFGAMPKTPLMMELQITQEYTGQAKHLVYLGTQWEEILKSDTYAKGPGTLVSDIIDGSAQGQSMSGIAGVSGIGLDKNWSGHHFSQANWYAYGRLAWNADLAAMDIAEEWTRMTWTNDQETVDTILDIMEASWPACVNYMTPLGLHHMMDSPHYGPAPGAVNPQRHDWSSTYYHKADAQGVGFDRSSTGTKGTSQYFSPLSEIWDSVETCPEKYLLWFHHVPWDYRLDSEITLWQQMRANYYSGIEDLVNIKAAWESLEGKVDQGRYEHVLGRLETQVVDAKKWRDTCIAYFAQFAEK